MATSTAYTIRCVEQIRLVSKGKVAGQKDDDDAPSFVGIMRQRLVSNIYRDQLLLLQKPCSFFC